MANVDDLFGPEKRTADDLFAPEPKIDHFTGPVADAFFQHNSAGRLLSAFGQGAKQGYGDGSGLGFSKAIAGNQSYVEGQKDWSAIHRTISKSLNENILRPVALAADTAWSAGSAAFSAAIKGTSEASNLLMEKAASPEPSLIPKPVLGAAGEALGAVVPSVDVYTNPYTGETQESGVWAMLPENMHPLSKPFVDRATSARAKGLIGEGEEGFFNTVPLTPEALEARRKASEATGTPVVIKPPETMATKVARMIDPQTFNELDRLHDVQENLRNSREALRAQIKEPTDPQFIYKEQQRIKKDLDSLVQPLVDVDLQLRDSLDKTKEVRERATATMEMEGPEGDAFRDYIQSKLLEAELNEEAGIAIEHAKTLMPEKTSLDVAKEDLKIVNKDLGNENKPTDGKLKSSPIDPSAPKTVDEVVIEPGRPGYTQQATIGTGDAKPFGLSRGIEERAKAYGLVDDLGELPERKAAELKKLEMDAEKLLSKDYAQAKRIAMGHEEAPEGIHPLAVLNAVEDRAHLERDVDTIRSLAHSELKNRVSEAGLDLRLQREKHLTDTNAIDRLNEIIDFRKKRNQRAVTEEGFNMGEALKTYMEKAESSIDDAIAYIRSLECDY